MKQLLITGISQETPLENPEETHIYLVFNHGECRVPTNEAGIQAIMQALAEGIEEVAVPETPTVADFGGAEVYEAGMAAGAQTNEEWLAEQEQAAPPDPDNEYEINDGVGSI